MPDTPGVPGDAAVLRAENAQLREADERLRMLGGDKDAVIADLWARNAELEERVARLERLISRNSGNSSMPPSADDQPGKQPPEPKKRRGGGQRKPGKQKGAPGAFLAWREDPDDSIPHFPRGTCACGADLSYAADLGVKYSHQVTDLPEARAATIQHGCGSSGVSTGCGTGDARGASRSRPPCPGRPGWPRRWSIVVVVTTTMGHRGGWRQRGAGRAG